MQTSEPGRCDPVTLEIIKGSLRAGQAEMEALLERTAMSPVIREKKDYFAGFFDPSGKMIAGTNLPIFGHIVEPFFEHYPSQTMRPGDIYWYNDCYGSKGGVSHSPDQVFVMPVFFDGKLAGFSQSWAHFKDIGGAWPGSMSPHATDIYQEGIIIPPVRLAREGVWNDEIARIFLRNGRFPDEQQGDLRALTAAVKLGERRFLEIFERFGWDVVHNAFERLNEQTRAAVVQHLRSSFHPGRYSFTDKVDSDGVGNGPFSIRFDMEVTEDRITIDSSRTDPQSPGPVNFLMNPAVPRMVFGIYALSNDASLLLNEGAMAAVDEVKVKEGTLVQPKFPGPLNQRGLTLMRVQAVCAGLLNVASGGKAVAATNAYAIIFLRGHDPKTKKPFMLSDGIGVGHGARSFADGHDAVYYVAQENTPAEFMDQIYPARLVSYSIHTDSGGPGQFRGGCGVVREVMWLGDDATLATRLDGMLNPPWGVSGGQSGRPGRCTLNPGTSKEQLVDGPLTDGTLVRRGDIIRVETGGGGGWGHPFDREVERVLDDVLGGYASIEGARADYGVVIDAAKQTFDLAATERLRGTQRPPAKLFHRRDYVEAMI
jgi:N-methylhydantoinase B